MTNTQRHVKQHWIKYLFGILGTATITLIFQLSSAGYQDVREDIQKVDRSGVKTAEKLEHTCTRVTKLETGFYYFGEDMAEIKSQLDRIERKVDG